MRFNSQRFNLFIANVGQDVRWRRSFSCPCANPVSGAPDPKHALCGGKGILWAEPVDTVCGVTRQDITPELVAAGVFDSGDMTMTVPADSPMWQDAGRFDRVVLLNSTDMFTRNLTRGAPSEQLLYTVARMARCFWLHPQTKALIEGKPPVVSADGRLSWPDGGEPPPGTVYSLTGERYDEYFVFDKMPSDRNAHRGMPLPKKLQLRRWDLFGR